MAVKGIDGVDEGRAPSVIGGGGDREEPNLAPVLKRVQHRERQNIVYVAKHVRVENHRNRLVFTLSARGPAACQNDKSSKKRLKKRFHLLLIPQNDRVTQAHLRNVRTNPRATAVTILTNRFAT